LQLLAEMLGFEFEANLGVFFLAGTVVLLA
jgi:hypothetical protein